MTVRSLPRAHPQSPSLVPVVLPQGRKDTSERPDIPAEYRWLAHLDGLPRMVEEALALYGTAEVKGSGDCPTIMGWASELGDRVAHGYYADAVPWCGLFMAVCAKRAAKTPPPKPLWALNWSKFGREAGQPMLGDVLTFVRPGGGHVGLYVGEDERTYHVLGGNQRDRVCFARIAKQRLNSARRPFYVNQPASVKMCWLGVGGAVSTDEA